MLFGCCLLFVGLIVLCCLCGRGGVVGLLVVLFGFFVWVVGWLCFCALLFRFVVCVLWWLGLFVLGLCLWFGFRVGVAFWFVCLRFVVLGGGWCVWVGAGLVGCCLLVLCLVGFCFWFIT